MNKVILPRDEVFKQDSRIAVAEQLSKIMLPEAITCHFFHLLEIFKKCFLRARIFTLKLLSGSSLHRKRVFVVETCTAHVKRKTKRYFFQLLEILKKYFLRARIFTLKLLSGRSLHRKRVFAVRMCTAHNKKKENGTRYFFQLLEIS